MAYKDLREWMAAMEQAGELKRVREEVDPILEITEITDRASKSGKRGGRAGGPALLFERVKGYPGARVLMNQFGSESRMKLALGVDELDEVAGRIRALLEMKSPDGLMEKLKLLPMLADIGKFFPKVIPARQAACKEVVKIGRRGDAINVLEFPVLQCWPMDGGRYITLPLVVTRDPKTSKRNMGMYRMQVYDGQTTGMHWQRQKNAAEHLRDRLRAQAGGTAAQVQQMAQTAGGTVKGAAAGKRMQGSVSAATSAGAAAASVTYTKELPDRLEVAVAIGTDPATTFAAIVPAPPEVEEYIIAGFLRQKPLELVQCETVDLQVPAHAEIILEGFVKLDELRTEGPFGDHTGFYTMEDEYPVFHITAITHRKHPIYAATIVGKPPMEDAWMGKAVERIFLPLMRLTLPEIVDINLPMEGVFHNIMVVSIRKSYAGHARKVMNGIWALGQAMFTKCIVVVDEDCDVQDLSEVVLRTANNIDPERDIQFTLGPVDSLDHASRLPNLGSKMGIDATQKWPAEGFSRVWPPMIEMDVETRARVDGIWSRLGIR